MVSPRPGGRRFPPGQDAGSSGAPRLTCLRLVPGDPGACEWRLLECQPFPEDSHRLFGAAKGGFLLLHRNGDLSFIGMDPDGAFAVPPGACILYDRPLLWPQRR
jgi:hypothetical protein